MRTALVLLCLALAAHAAALAAAKDFPPPKTKRVKVGVAGFDRFPFRYLNQTSGEWEGFLMDLLDAVCAAAYLDCQPVEFERITDRIPMVQSGKVDFVVDITSATPERATQVDFVHPGFYSAGAAIYTTPEAGRMLEAAGGWDALAGVQVCVVDGYYGTGALVNEYKIVPVEQATQADAAEAVLAGNCTAFAFDSGMPDLEKMGLSQAAGIQPVLTMPYAIPVKKGNDALRRRLSAALVEVMQSGNDSPILDWQQRWLSDNGVLSNTELLQVVQAISSFKGASCSDAAMLTR